MPAAVGHHRAFLLAGAGVLYPLVFAVFVVAERPGLGLGHFYYFPVAMVALASGVFWGAAAGLAATVLYTLGILINPHLASSQLLTGGSLIRLATLTTMGALVGWFASNHRDLSDRLRIANERDQLTGLLNTRAFDAALTARLEDGRPFGLVLADVDNMRELNDAEGHAVGNDVLRHAGDILGRTSDGEAQVARVGGDEFAVITSRPGSDAVRALCGRLTSALAEQGISMSFGWAVSPRDGESSLLLFRAADERLHAQKLIRSRLTAAEVVSLPTHAERLALRARGA
ncbi:MAG TPA: GGDEF domain-containing protein [Gaiellaceae bacterium]|nr:GGDEF domain-containing protein [Gaiellaceae bacterium]